MKPVIFSLFLLTALFLPLVAHAGIMPPCIQTGNCGMCDALWTIAGITRWIFGVVAVAALALMVYGGFLWITAAGAASRVQQGQKVMANTLIGIIIVIFTWTGINFIIASLTGQNYIGDNKVKIVQGVGGDQAWYEICAGTECEGKGDGHPCGNGAKHCINGGCVDGSACEWLVNTNKATYKGWGCNNFSDCGLSSYKACDTAPNCIRFLCGGGNETVCCKPESQSQ